MGFFMKLILYFLLDTAFLDTVLSSSTTNCKCGVTTSIAGRIFGGEEAKTGQFPWQVAIFTRGRSFHCGGSIINNLYILSAAHCFWNYNNGVLEDYTKENMTIMIGRYNRTINPGLHPNDRWSVKITLHPRYIKSPNRPENLPYDLAIVKLNKPIEEYNSNILPICLPSDNSKTYESEKASISGWGLNDGKAVTYLRSAEIIITKTLDCKERIEQNFPFSSKIQICLIARDKGTCVGDSGGPLSYKENSTYFVQIGVASSILGECKANNEFLFTRVSAFVTWIKNETKDASYCSELGLQTLSSSTQSDDVGFNSSNKLTTLSNRLTTTFSNHSRKTTKKFIGSSTHETFITNSSETFVTNLSTTNEHLIALCTIYILIKFLIEI